MVTDLEEAIQQQPPMVQFWATQKQDQPDLCTPLKSSDVQTDGSVSGEMRKHERTKFLNRVDFKKKYNKNDPVGFFKELEFTIRTVEKHQWLGKLEQCVTKSDLEAMLEHYMHFCERNQPVQDLSPMDSAFHNYCYYKSWLMERDLPDKFTYQMDLMDKFMAMTQDKTETVNDYIMRLQRMQVKIGNAGCPESLFKTQFLRGCNSTLRKKMFDKDMTPDQPLSVILQLASDLWKAHKQEQNFNASAANNALNTIQSMDGDGEEEELMAFQRGAKEYPPDDKVLDRSNRYLAPKFMQDSTFESVYTPAQVTERRALRKANAKASTKPHLFEKDQWYTKKVCVDCNKIGHTAGSTRCSINGKNQQWRRKDDRLLVAKFEEMAKSKGYVKTIKKSGKKKKASKEGG